jgi:hypothetical protein
VATSRISASSGLSIGSFLHLISMPHLINVIFQWMGMAAGRDFDIGHPGRWPLQVICHLHRHPLFKIMGVRSLFKLRHQL